MRNFVTFYRQCVLYLYLHNDEACPEYDRLESRVFMPKYALMYLCMNDMLSEREAPPKRLLFNIVNFGSNLADLFHEMELYALSESLFFNFI